MLILIIEIVVSVAVFFVLGMMVWRGLTKPRPGGVAVPVRDVDAEDKARQIEVRLLDLEQEVLGGKLGALGKAGEQGTKGRGGAGGSGGAGGAGG